MVLFETQRLYVRHFTKNDLDGFYRLNSDEEVMRYIRKPKTLDECRRFLSETIRGYKLRPHNGRFAIFEKSSNQYVGSFSLLNWKEQPRHVHIGYAFLKEHWGKGFATEITKSGIGFAFSKLQLTVLYAMTETGNEASKKVLLKCGFTQSEDITEDGVVLNLFEISGIH
jgi:[ribosomal protein S5]-alanine N-acetyltransferase